MTVAGDPLAVYDEDKGYFKQLNFYESKGFTQLGGQIDQAVRNQSPIQVTVIWAKKEKGGHVLRGLVYKVQSPNAKNAKNGKMQWFQVFGIAGNLNRAVLKLSAGGTIKMADAVAFAKDYGGELAKAWRQK